MWAGMSMQLHVGTFSVCVCLCVYDLSQEWQPFFLFCATLARTDNELCDHRLVSRLFYVCVRICVSVCGQCILGQPVWQQGAPQSHPVQQTNSAVNLLNLTYTTHREPCEWDTKLVKPCWVSHSIQYSVYTDSLHTEVIHSIIRCLQRNLQHFQGHSHTH